MTRRTREYSEYEHDREDDFAAQLDKENPMSEMRQLPRYKSHKEVWALKIRAVLLRNTGAAEIVPDDENYAPLAVPPEWVARHKPEAGGYYVQYADGYTSYSPAKAFEEGYTAIQPVPPMQVHCYDVERTAAQITNNFTYHAPKDDQIERYAKVRMGGRDLAFLLAKSCPPSRELSLAMTKLEEAVMWANAAIARNE
jgi:hypothetical protein